MTQTHMSHIIYVTWTWLNVTWTWLKPLLANQSCHIWAGPFTWMSRVSYEWVKSYMSHEHESCKPSPCKLVVSHMSGYFYMNESRSYAWVMSHMSHEHDSCKPSPRKSVVSPMSESFHTYKWVIYVMSHVTYSWVMIRVSPFTRMNESYHIWISHNTYEWVMSRMNEPCYV